MNTNEILKQLKNIVKSIELNTLSAWEDNLEETKEVVCLETFRGVEYNGWLEMLTKLIEDIDNTKVVYTAESGKEYTMNDIMKIAKGNRKLANILLSLSNWQHVETVFQDLLNEGEIDENGNILEQDDEYELVEGRTFARQCSVTGEPMNQGWVVGDGDMYIKYEKDAKKWATDNHYESLDQAHEDRAIYWTEWDGSDDAYKVVNGKLVEI